MTSLEQTSYEPYKRYLLEIAYAAANYTLAVPQFYGGRIQLLLPLCLTGDKPELALTIQREDGFYAARTCLTLDMAYNNARLICRPETSWIKR